MNYVAYLSSFSDSKLKAFYSKVRDLRCPNDTPAEYDAEMTAYMESQLKPQNKTSRAAVLYSWAALLDLPRQPTPELHSAYIVNFMNS